MEITHEMQGSNTYLVCKLSPEEQIDTSILGMLTNNNIDGIAQTIYTQIDDIRILKYNITAKLNIGQILESPLNKKRILSIFSEILSAVNTAEEYMIDESCLVINQDYIFTDISTNKTELICLPVNGASIEKMPLQAFFKNVLFNAQFDQNENSEYVTQMINYLNTNVAFSTESFYQTIQKMMVEKQEVVKPVKTTQKEPPKRKKEVPPVLTKKIQPEVVPETKEVKQPSYPPVIDKKINIPEESKPEEKPMSLFYLLQHYNSENKRIYDAQKAKKGQKGSNSKKDKEPKKKQAAPEQVVPGFAIPGQVISPTTNTAVQPTVEANEPAKQVEPKEVLIVEGEVPKVETPVKKVEFDFSQVKTSLYDELDDDEGTVIIGEEVGSTQQVTPYLFRPKTNERIYINKPVFKIGRSSDLIDYDVRDNKHIGHCHCHIVTRDTEYFIVDDNSRNHTYVDDVMITGSVEVNITHGQNIKLADEEFEFRLY